MTINDTILLSIFRRISFTQTWNGKLALQIAYSDPLQFRFPDFRFKIGKSEIGKSELQKAQNTLSEEPVYHIPSYITRGTVNMWFKIYGRKSIDPGQRLTNPGRQDSIAEFGTVSDKLKLSDTETVYEAFSLGSYDPIYDLMYNFWIDLVVGLSIDAS